MAAAELIPAVVVCHGSFNPVHLHHVAIMVRARAALEAAGYRVVAGMLAPCHSDRLIKKCGRDAIDDAHRFEALRLACKDAEGPQGWLYADFRGVNHTSGRSLISVLEPEVRKEHEGAVVFDILGSDVVDRCFKVQQIEKWPRIVVGRAGYTEKARKRLGMAGGEEGNAGAVAANRTLFVDELLGDLSSTKVRKALADGDADAVAQMCSPSVAEYLLNHQALLYAGADAEAAALPNKIS
jgi:nicotinic acid mononucleotide adenylyltransferase